MVLNSIAEIVYQDPARTCVDSYKLIILMSRTCNPEMNIKPIPNHDNSVVKLILCK